MDLNCEWLFVPTHMLGVVFARLVLRGCEQFKLISNFFLGVAEDVVVVDKGDSIRIMFHEEVVAWR
jgi:hypothetical protein